MATFTLPTTLWGFRGMGYYPHFVCEENETKRGWEENWLPKVRGLVRCRISGTLISKVLVQGESERGNDSSTTQPRCFIPFGIRGQDPLSMGILQTRILESVAIPFSRGSSQPRDQTQVFCIAGRFFTLWATRAIQSYHPSKSFLMAPDLAFSHSVGLLWYNAWSTV